MSSPVQNTRVLRAIPGIYFLLVAAEFVAMTHVAFVLTQRGYSATAVGFVATLMWLGIFAGSWLSAHLTPRLGRERAFRHGVQALALCLLGMALVEGYSSWALLGGLLGLTVGVIWVTGEAWLAEIAPPERRGFYVGLFETAVGLGMMSGPLLLGLIDRWGGPPFWVAAAMGAVTWLTSQLLPHTEPSQVATASAVTAEPETVALPPSFLYGIAAVSLLSGLLESGSAAMLPGLSLRLGFTVQQAAWLGALIGAGSALLQTPAGHASDRVGLRAIETTAWLGLLLASLALLLGTGTGWLWLAGFVYGGMGGIIYTLAMVELGHRLRGTALVRATSLLVVCYTAGSASGPLLGGWLFDQGGLLWLAAGLGGMGLLGLLVNLGRPAGTVSHGS